MTDAIDLCDEDASQGGNAAWLLDDGDENEASPYRQQASSVAAEQHTAAEVQTNTELYVLDCGCQGRHAELVRKLHENCGLLQEAGFGQTADSLAMAVSSVSCAYCSSLLSAQDTWKLLGPDVSSKLYTTLASSVKQVALAQQGQVRQQTADTQAAAVAGVCCELWGELAALQSLVLGGDPTPPKTTAAAAAGTPSRRGRSAKQQQAKPPAKPKAKKAAKGSGGSGAWAAGTGYGGSDGMTKAAQAAMSAAAARQAAADSAMIAHLTAITAILQDPLGTSTAAAASDPGAAGPSRKRGRSAACLYSGLPWPLCGVALAGPLAWLLRLLFHNDSLMDVVERQELYSAAMELLRHIGCSPDLLPLLQLPADDPRDSCTPSARTATAAGPSSSTTSLLATLRRLEQQASLYKRSAEQLMGMVGDEDSSLGDDEETTAAVCLALDLSSMVETLKEGVDLWTSTLGHQHSALNIKSISAALDTQQPAQQQAAGLASPADGPARGKGRDRAAASSIPPAQLPASAPPAALSAEAAAAAAQAERYVAAMQPFAFIEADLLGSGHYFAQEAAANAQRAAGGEVMRRRLKRITEELGALSTSLPLGWDSSILLAVHADRLDVLRACLLPHPDTPYGGGAFLFDLLLPPEYPDQPPKVKFLTTGGGIWSANPNLYACGKVCLSLLGTWAGPSWEPGVSTLLQVLVSLQSMVFVPDPYFNEPGYERHATTAAGKAQGAKYNAEVRLGTVTHALLDHLRQPDPVFGGALRLHYSHQRQRVTALMQQWLKEAKHPKTQLQQVVTQAQQELSRLPAPAEQTQQQQQQQQGRAAAEQQGDQGAGTSRPQQAAQVEILGDHVDVVDLT